MRCNRLLSRRGSLFRSAVLPAVSIIEQREDIPAVAQRRNTAGDRSIKSE